VPGADFKRVDAAVILGFVRPMPDTPPPIAADPEREALAARLTQAEQAAAQKRFNEAVGICRDVLDANADCAPAYAVWGAIEAHRGALTDAATLLERAIRLDPGQAAWHGNLSGIYRVQYRLDEALVSAREAVRLAPALARNFVNLAKVLVDRGERDDAVACFLNALVRETENPEAHLGIGQILLAEGEFRPGWIEYAWRNELDQAKGLMPRMVTPVWSGMRLPRDRVLLVGDQGFGDSIQFARYIPLVAERCGEVVVGCSPELAPLLGTIAGVTSVHTRWDEIPRHLAHSLLSSLPGILGTELHSIPCSIPYMKPDATLRAVWAERLLPLRQSGKRLVGLVWAGRPTHPNDGRRSLPLEALAPLAKVDGVQLISLQKPVLPRDAAQFAALGLTDWSAQLSDFSQTLALVAELDLVITIDSAVAHLAGAAGRPVWVMMPTPADWRWMHARSDSPWYPSMRLFRQTSPGSWGQVFGDLIAALPEFVKR
jgi:Tfp pilus assembly protein PilF